MKKGQVGIAHGLSRHPLYLLWNGMKQRCANPKSANYKNYGAKGVRVCARWVESFPAFLADMGERPAGKSLDRYPNAKGNYEPGNCRWASRQQQNENTSRNRYLEVGGERLTISQWARKLGVSRLRLTARLNRGWSDSDTVLKLMTIDTNMGETNGQAKVTAADVLAIRARYPAESASSLAKEFGLAGIDDIISRRSWRHL